MQAQSTTTAQCIGFLFFGSSKNNSIYETLQQVRECICVCACVWKAFNSVPIKVTYQSMVHNALQKKRQKLTTQFTTKLHNDTHVLSIKDIHSKSSFLVDTYK
jgi:hypothetical protein